MSRKVDRELDPILLHPLIYSEVRSLVDDGQVAAALDFIRMRSQQEDVRFMLVYAICLARGVMGLKDTEEAKRLFYCAEKSESTDVLSLLGEAYQYGYIYQDRVKAEHIFRNLREISPFKGNYMLARFYHSKRLEGGACHKSTILKYYKEAAISGHLISAYFHSSLSSNSKLQGKLRFFMWGASETICGPKLSRIDRLWRYSDLRLVSPRLFEKYDVIYANAQRKW